MNNTKRTGAVQPLFHSFSVEEAIKYGAEKAIILQSIRFWLEKNLANEKNIHDGYVWTFNSSEAFALLFPYFAPRSIRRWLQELEEDEGILKSANYNRAAYDKTKWYTIPTEYAVQQTLGQNGQSNGQIEQSSGQNGQPIPVVSTDVEPDTAAAAEEEIPFLPKRERERDTTRSVKAEEEESEEDEVTFETDEEFVPTRSLARKTAVAQGYKGHMTEPLLQWAQARMGRKFANPMKQKAHIAKLLRAGYEKKDIEESWERLEGDTYWAEKGFDFATVLNEMSKNRTQAGGRTAIIDD